MPEEAPEAPELDAEDTPPDPEAASPEETPAEDPKPPAEPPEGYVPEDRYNNLRSETDRTKQLIAALEGKQGPEAQKQAFEYFGYELPEEEDTDDESPDPLDDLEELKRWRQEREEQEEQERFEHLEDEFLNGARKEIEKDEDRELNDKEWKLIRSYALSNRDPDSGRPDVEGGHEHLRDVYSNAQERLLKPKKNPAKPGKGTAGVEKDDLSTPEGREKAALAAATAAQSE